MNPLEITLIIIGIVVIIISCFLVDRSKSQSEEANNNRLSLFQSFTEEELIQITNRTNELMSRISEETLNRTDDNLSKLSNEKIMAVSEFSDQVLEKINRNHEEVVFLYNMLNDKEKDLKAVVREIDTSKNTVQKMIDNNKELDKATNKSKPNAPDKSNKKNVKAKQFVQEQVSNTEANSDTVSNNNAQILDLYSKGKSVVEISKQLGLGQGEVKLVIGLYQGKE